MTNELRRDEMEKILSYQSEEACTHSVSAGQIWVAVTVSFFGLSYFCTP
jgi:hypothetical protein